jgi:hypothetical protein
MSKEPKQKRTFIDETNNLESLAEGFAALNRAAPFVVAYHYGVEYLGRLDRSTPLSNRTLRGSVDNVADCCVAGYVAWTRHGLPNNWGMANMKALYIQEPKAERRTAEKLMTTASARVNQLFDNKAISTALRTLTAMLFHNRTMTRRTGIDVLKALGCPKSGS